MTNHNMQHIRVSLPDGLPKLGAVTDAIELIDVALDHHAVTGAEVSAGYLYDRKGYPTVDLFGAPRNTRYGSNADEIVVSVTVRITPQAIPESDPISALEQNYLRTAEEQKALDAVAEAKEAVRLAHEALTKQQDALEDAKALLDEARAKGTAQ